MSTQPIPEGRLSLEIVRHDDGWPEWISRPQWLDDISSAIGAFVEFDTAERVVIAFSCDAEVRSLNSRFRNQDKPTNVLSFPALKVPTGQSSLGRQTKLQHIDAAFLGDIVLARETIIREAGDQSTELRHHVVHLIVHGILHLLGYDHLSADEAAEMEALEIDILNRLEIANPYTEELVDAN